VFLTVTLAVIFLALACAFWYDRRHGRPNVNGPHQSSEIPPRANWPDTGSGG
jgi:hypothetical protein